ncbi:MAG: DUF2202 domain-containing protein [Rickettsiales bacterium]|nr:DUF2202 domain-containing protein [Rickettsiales bacterium]
MKHHKLRAAIAAAAYLLSSQSALAYSDEIVNAIHTALDDEYKAHTTYAAYLEHFGEVKPFSNIIHSEARHIEALKALLTDSAADIPENPYNIAEIEIPTSATEACEIAVKAEEENAALYFDQLLPTVKTHDEVVSVFTNLADASQQRHLQAFQRCASRGKKWK